MNLLRRVVVSLGANSPTKRATALPTAQLSADGLDAPSSPPGREDLADDCRPIFTLIHLAGAMVPEFPGQEQGPLSWADHVVATG
jgi:hypothetical protein